MNSSGVIIFSRFDSTRLPGKALIDIAGRPLLGHIIDRCRKIKGHDNIVVATTSRHIDDPIADFSQKEGIDFYRGDLNNVAKRAFDCATYYNFNAFARICGDRIFFSPELVTQYFEIFSTMNVDIVTNANPVTFPPGLTTEIIKTRALDVALQHMTDEKDMEHLTRYFYQHPEQFNIYNIINNNKLLSSIRLVVDTTEDLNRAVWIASQFTTGSVASANIEQIAKLARQYESQREQIQ